MKETPTIESVVTQAQAPLALADIQGIIVAATDSSAMAEIAALSGSGFLARLQLMTSASPECKSGAFPINNYALVSGSDLQNIGPRVEVIAFCGRTKALDMSGDKVISNFTPAIVDGKITNAEFLDIAVRSGMPDSKCMFGPEYLVWLPAQKSWATLFFGSKTMRNEAPKMSRLVGQPTTLTSQRIANKKYEWFSLAISPSNVPPANMPTAADATAQIQRFKDEQVREEEVADDEARAAGKAMAAQDR